MAARQGMDTLTSAMDHPIRSAVSPVRPLPPLAHPSNVLAFLLSRPWQATGALHGLVVADGHVAAACTAPGLAPLQRWDVLLLLNLLGANASFRHSGEAMTPVCLPRFNPGGRSAWGREGS